MAVDAALAAAESSPATFDPSAYDDGPEPDAALAAALAELERPIKPVTTRFVVVSSIVHCVLITGIGLLGKLCIGVQNGGVRASDGAVLVPWWIGPASYALLNAFALTTHWAGHQSWSGSWFTAHVIGHHIADYPSKRFFSHAYVNAKYDNSRYYFPAMLCVPVAFGFLRGCVWTWQSNCVAFAVAVFVMFVADHFHQNFHLKRCWLDRFQFFGTLRTLHFYHHKGSMQHNFAIGDFLIDLLTAHFVTHNMWAKANANVNANANANANAITNTTASAAAKAAAKAKDN